LDFPDVVDALQRIRIGAVKAAPSRRALAAAALVSALPAFTLAAAALGYGVDHLLGTSPVFTLLLLVVGFVAGVVQLLRGLARLPE
jgi:F0F1-type ATP synthase assembly protein I